jgi:hypothetical protein
LAAPLTHSNQVTKQAMNYAIKTGITITSGYAIRQCGKLLKVLGPEGLANWSHTNEHQTVEGQEKDELASLQLRLEGKIRVCLPLAALRLHAH